MKNSLLSLRENPDRIEGKLVAINPPGLSGERRERPPPQLSLLIGCCCDPGDWVPDKWSPQPGLSRSVPSSSSSSSWRLGRKPAKRSPKWRCYLRDLGSTSPGCTALGSGPKASPSPTCWAWSRTCRRGSNTPAVPRVRACLRRAPGPGRSRRGAAEAWAGSPSRGGRCRWASASCAVWRRSSPLGRRASCRDTCRCCRPGPTATTCRTWRPRGTRTPVRTRSTSFSPHNVWTRIFSFRWNKQRDV